MEDSGVMSRELYRLGTVESRADISSVEAAKTALGDLPAGEVLAATPRRLHNLVDRSYYQDSMARTPAGWTLNQTLHRLAESETAFAVRLAEVLLSNSRNLGGYGDELWLQRFGDRRVRVEPTLERFKLLRAENLELIAGLTAAESEAVADLIQIKAAHDLLHLKPMEEAIAGRSVEVSALRGVQTGKENPFELPPKRGRLIVICGIDGAGKTSQALELVDWLKLANLNAVYHKPLGIRSDLDHLADRLGRTDHIDLFGADTARLLRATVRWASMTAACATLRDESLWLVMDRYAYCEYAATRHQGASNESLLREMYAGLPTPDLTLLFDVDPEIAFERVNKRGVDNDSLRDLREFAIGYRELPEMESGIFTTINGNQDFASMRAEVRATVRAEFPELADVQPSRLR